MPRVTGCSESGEDDGEIVLVAGSPVEGYRRRSPVDSVGYGRAGEDITAPGPTLHVVAGEPVTITLENEHYRNDVPYSEPHSFAVVSELGAILPEPLWGSETAAIQTGESDTVTFTADAPGTYYYICTISGHRTAGMYGEFIVDESSE